MGNNISNEPMLEMFIFETLQLIEQLEQCVLSSEKSSEFKVKSVNEIFRIMHTIKGSAAMMLFDDIAMLAHSIEDLFYYLRENKPDKIDYSMLTDIVLKGVDFIKDETNKLKNNEKADGDPSCFIEEIKNFLIELESNNTQELDSKSDNENHCVEEGFTESCKINKCYKAHIYFEEDCGMENIRAFGVIRDLNKKAEEIRYIPDDINDNDDSKDIIKNEGFKIFFKSDADFEEIKSFFEKTIFLKDFELIIAEDTEECKQVLEKKEIILGDVIEIVENTKKISACEHLEKEGNFESNKQSIISVNVDKLDKLMDLVGELVISEAMVTENTDLQGLTLNNFYKASRQLKKITSELQDTVMSIRMVPLSLTFQKMNRIVRDMNKKLNKEVELQIIGEETEVDKNIIEHIADPLMHLIRNSIDHGIESKEERISKGKNDPSRITLEAKSAGGDVWIIVKDNGRGLDKKKILEKAIKNGLLNKPENELTDKEIYSFIILPGFSTNREITEFSGRGVGMDVVLRNIQKVGGTVLIDSEPNKGTTISLKIPLTMAIIDGINIKVGNSRYTVPTIAIKECFKPKENDVIIDPDGNEMMMIRGKCLPIIRLHKLYKLKNNIEKIQDGIIMIVENGAKTFCIFFDELLGEKEVVVKALPAYIKKVKGIGGCTLLGDGNISLILDIAGICS
ncbi:chemotaxis protein CheA [Clostridium uliginosum]|uniref:Chemotaxis protein CheA n=1 Tax=Clostridium uliginosum TaxID=119641 RepID=A0A1I1N1P1_9CLOT|nr:chemotaxis protein CheA [Clostridium uliginosum]SFC91539.1 two-component system, chemotaxis family, sensor kinase CheA [Clostridium uliginosum]